MHNEVAVKDKKKKKGGGEHASIKADIDRSAGLVPLPAISWPVRWNDSGLIALKKIY